ncbi:hypothetical protein EV122DRAFT_220806 [Schizophyllum commune]
MVVVFEFLSTLLTMVQCVPAVREQRRIGTSGVFQRTLIVAIFEQGIAYYCFVSVFTVTALILNYIAPKGFPQRLLNAFTLPISGILTARFILHLRTMAGQDVIMSQTSTDDSLELSRMTFHAQDNPTVAGEPYDVSRSPSRSPSFAPPSDIEDDGIATEPATTPRRFDSDTLRPPQIL